MNDWLDVQLGRITIYRLVLYALLSIVAMALLLMVVGQLSYSPLSFVLSLVVTTGAAYASNKLFGWLFGVRPHGESALITGLILALLFIPPASPVGFIKLALVAIIAMASKYIIAIRGRHLFNPAAIAVVIASVSGLAFAGWWIATPAMIPVTALAALAVLYRTKKLIMAAFFLLAAIISLLIQGTDPITALVSWPIVFAAGIMLSEPLTLPPKAKQQFAVAILVGVMMTVPFHYGRITMTPALAIIVGNAAGWWLGQRKAIRLRYIGKKQMGGDVYDFTFDTQPLSFEPGQYMELSIPHKKADSRGMRRVFSIASRPGEDQVSIGTRLPKHSSSFKKALSGLSPGDTLYATRIGGDFTLPKQSDVPIVCIAGGIGVTPFISFILSSNRKIKLIYAVSDNRDLAYVDILKQHAVEVVVISPDDGKHHDPDWQHVKGRIDTQLLDDVIDVSSQPEVYVSGPPAMVMNTRRLLKNMGIRHIKVDEFSGY